MRKVIGEDYGFQGFVLEYSVLQPWREMRSAAVSLLPEANDTNM